jgi:hypothetical protein
VRTSDILAIRDSRSDQISSNLVDLEGQSTDPKKYKAETESPAIFLHDGARAFRTMDLLRYRKRSCFRDVAPPRQGGDRNPRLHTLTIAKIFAPSRHTSLFNKPLPHCATKKPTHITYKPAKCIQGNLCIYAPTTPSVNKQKTPDIYVFWNDSNALCLLNLHDAKSSHPVDDQTTHS